MKILLFGKDGQLGWELQRSLAALGPVVALGRHSADYCGDLTQLQALAQTVRAVRPDVVVNAAAYTAVDQAESEPDLAHLINAQAPCVLAQEASQLGAWMVHYSSDYVFDGSGSTPWTEQDRPAPLSCYGHTKWQGEQRVAAQGLRHLIFRTSWLYSPGRPNFAQTMLHLAQEREQLVVVTDQVGAPTGADLVADVTVKALRTVLRQPQLAGLYHLTAQGQTSRYDYAQFVLGEFQQAGCDLKVGPSQIQRATTAAFPTPAQRPLNSRLATDKLQAAFGVRLPNWKDGVMNMLRQIR